MFPTVAGKLPGTQKACADVKTAGYHTAMVDVPRLYKVSLNSFHMKGTFWSSASKKEYFKRPGGFRPSSRGDKTHQSETLLVHWWFPSHSSICCSWTMIVLFHYQQNDPSPPQRAFYNESYKVLDLLTVSISREALFVWQ